MKTETLNIRAYKVITPDGKIYFEDKSKDSRGSTVCDSIKSLVHNVKINEKQFLKNKAISQVTIDLKPYHDIECPSGLAPMRCLPLSEKEAEDFWNHYCLE